MSMLSLMAHADPKSLQHYSATLGVKAPIEPFKAIDTASKLYGIDPKQMVAIALIESRMNPKALNMNTNGTRDIGLFQINTVLVNTECVEFNVFSVQGNTLCAAKILKGHKAFASADPEWVGRFHSKTPDIKTKYVQQLANLEMRGN